MGDTASGDRDRVPQRLQLVLLGGVALLPPGPPRPAGLQVVGEPAAVTHRPAERGIEVDHVRAHRIQERPVVAGCDHRPRQAS